MFVIFVGRIFNQKLVNNSGRSFIVKKGSDQSLVIFKLLTIILIFPCRKLKYLVSLRDMSRPYLFVVNFI